MVPRLSLQAEAGVGFSALLQAAARDLNPGVVEAFRAEIPLPWVDDALRTNGTAHVRKRKLPAELVVWAVIGMGLFRDRPILEVVDGLDLVLPDKNGRVTIASSAVTSPITRFVAISAAMAVPDRLTTMSAVSSGPSSRMTATTTTVPM